MPWQMKLEARVSISLAGCKAEEQQDAWVHAMPKARGHSAAS